MSKLKKIPIQCPNCQHMWDRKPTVIEKAHGASANADKKSVLFYLFPYCWLCGIKFNSIDEATIEHIRPIIAGGKDMLANLTLTHEACNRLKGAYYPAPHKFTGNKIRGIAALQEKRET